MATPLYQAKAEFFRTLGHPARIRILELLSERDHAVHELLAAIDIEPSNLSQQLAVLRRAGLVQQRREGSEVVYAVSVPEVRDLLLARRAIQQDANDPTAYNTLALALLRAGRLDDADKALAESRRRNPEGASIWDHLIAALLASKRGQPDRVQTALAEVDRLRRDPAQTTEWEWSAFVEMDLLLREIRGADRVMPPAED